MANLSYTYTLTPNTTADATQVMQDFNDAKTWLNNRDNATDYWQNVKISTTASNPVDISSSASSTEVSINNSATDGDPILTFKLSGAQTHVVGVDDSDSDILKFATSSLTTNVAMQIPTAGLQVQFAAGTVLLPSLAAIGDTNTGIYFPASDAVELTAGGIFAFGVTATIVQIETGHTLTIVDAGSNSAPIITWLGDTDTGIAKPLADTLELVAGGQYALGVSASIVQVETGHNIQPAADNAQKCGINGKRWSEVWAANGSIQTSHTSTKSNIESIDEPDILIPEAIKFNRPEDKHSAKQIGFAADNLPEECFAVIDDEGNRSTTDIYLSSVVGLLCAAVKKLDARIAALE